MRDLDELAQALIARCAAEGQAATDVPDRHYAEALRAELRRLARDLDMHVRTLHSEGRVVVVRTDAMPWDPTDAEAAEQIADYIAGRSDEDHPDDRV